MNSLYEKSLDRIRLALEAGLDAAAPDGGSWLAGQEQFWDALHRGASIEQALEVALDAAAPDGGSWLKGQEVFNRHLSFVPLGLRRVLTFRDNQYSPGQRRRFGFYHGAHE